MRVFLTGASGYVGRHVAIELLSRGHNVVGLARRHSERTKYSSIVEWCIADLAEFNKYRAVLEDCDCVIHCAMDYSDAGSENVELDERFIEHLSGSSQHVIYTGNLFSTRRDATSRFLETQELDPINWRFKNENLVLRSFKNRAVIRLGFVYGGTGGYLWDILSAGTVFGMIPDEIPSVLWPMIHIRDAASLYGTVAESRAAGVFHAYDGLLNRASEIIESVKSVYKDSGILDSDPHDYVDGLLRNSIQTTNERSTSIGWYPRFSNFNDQASQSFRESSVD